LLAPELRGRHKRKTPTSEAGVRCASVVKRLDSDAQPQPAARERMVMMRVPMVSSQSIHNEKLKYGGSGRSSGDHRAT
jgi:hypothetical protein